jgi:hypothetical protein
MLRSNAILRHRRHRDAGTRASWRNWVYAEIGMEAPHLLDYLDECWDTELLYSACAWRFPYFYETLRGHLVVQKQ